MMSPWRELDRRALRDWPLPAVAADADKEDRGRVLVIGGSRELAGAALLAAIAALRAGAGKLVVATGASVAALLVTALPEARIIALPETPLGGFRTEGIESLLECATQSAAVLMGPGMMDPVASADFVRALLPRVKHVPVVLDALAMDLVLEAPRFEQPVLLTPHAGEMAHLCHVAKETVWAQPHRCAQEASRTWNAVVALKGPPTWIASPSGAMWRHTNRLPGLGTSGSGDVLAGLVTGLAARGAPLEQAAAWGVAVHAGAGAMLARERGPLGFLARELAPRVPAVLRRLERRRTTQN